MPNSACLLRIFFLLTAFAGVSACGTEARYPFAPEPTRSPPPSEIMGEHLGRLRISVASEEVAPDFGVRLGRVVACSATACYQAPTPAQVALANTSQGKATFVVDMAVPRQAIEAIYFEDVTGLKVIAGQIDLKMYRLLDAPYQGAEIFVVMRKTSQGIRTVYEPSRVATNWVSKGQQPVFYVDPRFATELVGLELGTQVSIPAGSTQAPQIFFVWVHDIGTAFPAVDIYPKMTLVRPWTVHLTEVMKPWKEPGYAGPPPIIPHRFESSVIRPFVETGVLAKYSEQIWETGFRTLEPKDAGRSEGTTSSAAEVTNCLDALSARRLTSNMTLPPGVDYIGSCVGVPPFVHIAVANVNDPRRWLYVRAQSSSYIGDMLALDLQPITNFSTVSAIAINGFTWTDSKGIFDGGKGLPNGYLATNGMHAGDNRVGGGYSKTVPGTPDSNKFVFRWNRQGAFQWEEKSGSTLFDLSIYDHHVSSSTSIVKSGNCTSLQEMDRWSAFGTSDDGTLVFVSSTSGGQTTPAELCRVFQRLGVDNALRLDGGTAAAMVVGGELLNPLEGVHRALMGGPLRDIAYAVVMR